MKIFFDHQTFSQQNYGGISRYFCELISGINQPKSQHRAHLSLLFSNNAHLKEKHLRALPFFPNLPLTRTQGRLYQINRAYSELELRLRSFDVIHPTYYDPYFFQYAGKRPTVVTFLDMIHEKFFHLFPDPVASQQLVEWKKQAVEEATALIAISESTKRDMVAHYGVSPDRIRVIYLGTSLPLADISAEPPADQPYLLFVGNRPNYKNFVPFLQAVAPILRERRIRLVCAGGGAFLPEEEDLIRQANVTDLVEQQPINDASLRRLYSQALAFAFPSLYEGFGIPVMEAFACNCPCLLSNQSSLPEIAGSAALYFDPNDLESMRRTVEQFLADPALRPHLIQAGRDQLARFSWQNTVRETLALYESLG